MHSRMTILVPGLLALMAGGAAAQSIPCGQEYIVGPGDTLSQIAIRAYDSSAGFQLIYSANASVIGPNPGVIEVGARYQIPCIDGDLGTSTANPEVVVRETEQAVSLPLLVPVQSQIRFVTATGWAPYHNEAQAQGGMITEIVNVAMSKVVGADEYKIDFVNDWSAHLQPLVADLAYDFSLSWYRPNCDVADRLGPSSRLRCNSLDWSEALYEEVLSYYTLASAAAPLSHTDLFGTTICLPAGFSLFPLEEFDLIAPNVAVIQPVRTEECFEALANGEADAVLMGVNVADGAIATAELEGEVVKHDVLDYVATIHAVTSKENPDGLAQLALLDQGVKELKDSGEWFSIVRRHLTEHRMNGGS